MKTFSDWRKLLFNDDEWVCSALDTYGTAVMPVSRLDESATFFSINPLARGTKRLDENVTVYRNLLIEIDSIALNLQRKAIADLQIPYTSVVYSGAKSLHVIVSLVSPVTRQEYEILVLRFMKAVPICDVSTKNPSRLSRVPNSRRDETNRIQGLIALGARVPNETFEAWLCAHGAADMPAPRGERVRETAERNREIAASLGIPSMPVNGRTWRFLKYGSVPGRNHAEALQAAYDMAACGMTADEAMGMLETAPWPSVEEYEIANIIEHVYSKLLSKKENRA